MIFKHHLKCAYQHIVASLWLWPTKKEEEEEEEEK
jgi:hypothetical protein